MSVVFECACPDLGWRDVMADIEAVAVQAAAALPAQLFPQGESEVSLVLMDDAGVKRLNHDYRGQDKPTNILSFPAVQAPGLLGDIVLARETVTAEAEASGKTMPHHLSHLIIHGLLHLLGYDHIAADEAEVMEAIEITALAKLGIANPYVLQA